MYKIIQTLHLLKVKITILCHAACAIAYIFAAVFALHIEINRTAEYRPVVNKRMVFAALAAYIHTRRKV